MTFVQSSQSHAEIHRPEFYRASDDLAVREWIEENKSINLPIVWAESDALEEGDLERVNPLYTFHRARYEDDIPLVNLESVAAGEDYEDQSHTIHRSNFRSLQKDYDQVPWVLISYTTIDYLAIPVGYLMTEDGQELWNVLTGLAEQDPVYDNSDHSELETEEIYASWTQFGQQDITIGLSRRVARMDPDDPTADFLTEASEWIESLDPDVFFDLDPGGDRWQDGYHITHTGNEVVYEYTLITNTLVMMFSIGRTGDLSSIYEN